MSFRRDFAGNLLQLFPLGSEYIKELTGAGNIVTEGKRAIVFFDGCNITVDGGVQVPVVAGSTWALACDVIAVDASVRYGIV